MDYIPHITLILYLVGLLALGILGLLKGRRAKHAEPPVRHTYRI